MADWPVHAAMVNETWYDLSRLVTVVVVRRHPTNGKIAIGMFVVDLKCLGVKLAYLRRVRDVQAYERRSLPALRSELPPLVDVSPALAAKIVAEGLAYAASLGIEPHPEFDVARCVLDGIDPAGTATKIAVGGLDGRPVYVVGPFEDPTPIMTQLERAVGPRGFEIVAPLGFGRDVQAKLDATRDDVLSELIDELESLGKLGTWAGHKMGVPSGYTALFFRCLPLALDEMGYVDLRGVPGIADCRRPVIELYCNNPRCDCRRVLLAVHVAPDQPPAAIINFSWADARHLKRWMGNPRATPAEIAFMQGPMLEPTDVQSPSAALVMDAVAEQLLADPEFVARLARHYDAFRASPGNHAGS